MKLLLENWRKHLKEVNDDDDRYTGSPIGSIPPGTEDQQEEQSRQNAIEQFTKLKDDLDRGGGLNIPSRSDEEAALIGALEYAIKTLASRATTQQPTPADSDEYVELTPLDVWAKLPIDLKNKVVREASTAAGLGGGGNKKYYELYTKLFDAIDEIDDNQDNSLLADEIIDMAKKGKFASIHERKMHK